MRVITGSAKGRRLEAPLGLDTRPTSDRTKEGMFSIVQFEVEQSDVLDLFAGSGQLGIEALSRGARMAIFIDQSRDAQAVILDNLTRAGLRERARVSQMDATSFLRGCREHFDLAFLDPPYHQGILTALLPLVAPLIRPSGILLCETQHDEVLPDAAGDMTQKREYRYGHAKVTTYRRGEEVL
ncbi:MAG: 16S rRNA (guanine(966)-N(2))-methyltransferase RsmD [Oscillospiraceae bacterium]